MSKFIEAVRWYKSDRATQYDSAQKAQFYDEIVNRLSAREEFGHFLAESIGVIQGKMLEIAAGTGAVSRALGDRYPDLLVCDISRPALKILQEKQTRATIVQSNFFAHPFLDNSFDTIVCVGGYRYVPEEMRNTFWSEARRVIKPGGKLYVGQFYPIGFPLEGTDIGSDVEKSDHGFVYNKSNEFVAHMRVGPMAMVSGKYSIFTFEQRGKSVRT